MEVNPSLEAHLRQLEEQLLQPAVRESAEEVDKLLAEAFIEYNTSDLENELSYLP